MLSCVYFSVFNFCFDNFIPHASLQPNIRKALLAIPSMKGDNLDENLLYQVQRAFAHLHYGNVQYFVPQGIWKSYRHWGEPINVREQKDAHEFFDNFVDQIDEALKSQGYAPVIKSVIGGTFADQKIIKSGCTHRYEKEDMFTTLAVDIRNHRRLEESLEQYVKGDLLEGDNAYKVWEGCFVLLCVCLYDMCVFRVCVCVCVCVCVSFCFCFVLFCF